MGDFNQWGLRTGAMREFSDGWQIVTATADDTLAEGQVFLRMSGQERQIDLDPVIAGIRDALDQELAASGVRLTAAAEVDGLRLLASLAYQGYAPALLPASAVSGYPEGDWSLVHVEGLARRSVGLVRNRRTTPSMPSRAARDVVLEVIREIAPHQPGIHVTLGG